MMDELHDAHVVAMRSFRDISAMVESSGVKIAPLRMYREAWWLTGQPHSFRISFFARREREAGREYRLLLSRTVDGLLAPRRTAGAERMNEVRKAVFG